MQTVADNNNKKTIINYSNEVQQYKPKVNKKISTKAKTSCKVNETSKTKVKDGAQAEHLKAIKSRKYLI